MTNIKGKNSFHFIAGSTLVLLFLLAFSRSYVRIQTTLIGYKLGKLKKEESLLLENRSRLQMELAKLTTKSHLILLSQNKNEKAWGAIVAH